MTDDPQNDDWRSKPPPAWTPGAQPPEPPAVGSAPQTSRSGPPVSDDGRFWWDGQRWWPIERPTQAISTGPSAWTIARGVALGIAVTIAGLVFLASCNESSARSDYIDCLTENPLSGSEICVEP